MPAQHEPNRRQPAPGIPPTRFDPRMIVLVTICTENREAWLATPRNHDVLRSVWSQATTWRTGRYLLMPDHLHLFAAPGEPALPFDNWIRYWESQFSKEINDAHCRWQADHSEHRLQRGQQYAERWEYVRENPVRAGLVQRADDWLFQGEIFELDR